MNSTTKYIIIGAGLSGLTSAYELHKSGEKDFLVLDSRTKIGGRIVTKNHIDLGATWFQSHHTNVNAILRELNINKFPQYTSGNSVLVYSSMAPAHYFKSDPDAPSASRISGGSSALITKLAQGFTGKIKTDATVLQIEEEGNYIKVSTKDKIYIAEKVVLTVPPRIISRINFSPQLPTNLIGTMKNTHTWMSNAIKVGLKFKQPFWKKKDLSGTIIGQVGAVTELYDHCNFENSEFGLMGFVNEALRDLTPKERKNKILYYLSKYLGKEVMDHTFYYEKDWSKDANTSCITIKSIYMSPTYGDSLFANTYFNGKLIFSGTETSPVYGGYMDGAIYSGKLAAKKLLDS